MPKKKQVAVKRKPPPNAEASQPKHLPDIDAFPPWRSVDQACVYLQVALPTVYRMLKTGELMSYTVGSRRRIPSSEIKSLMGLADRVKLKRKVEPFKPLVEMPNPWANMKPAKTSRASRVA